MTTFELIDNIKSNVASVKGAIENKGVDVPAAAKLEDLPELINSIESGGSGEEYTITDGDYLFHDNARLDAFSILKKHFALTSCKDMFSSASNTTDNILTTEDINGLDLTNVSTCYYMFNKTTHRNVVGDLVFDIPKCTNMSYFAGGYGLNNATSITFLNSSKVSNWQQIFYGGFNKIEDAQNKALTTLRWDLSGCTNCSNIFCSSSHTYSGCKFLSTIDFQGGSFGGNVTTSTLTLDLSKLESMTKDSFVNMFNTLGTNTRAKTRIIKISQTIYESMTEDELSIATSKGYTISY